MRIESVFYGMQTADGKINLVLSPGARQLISSKGIEYLKQLRPEDSHKYLWFKETQTIAYPVVIEVADKHPKHGGRTFIQNHTQLVNIHEFVTHFLNNGFNPFTANILPEQENFPSIQTVTV